LEKKSGSIPENSGKCPAQLLMIGKKSGSIPENSGKCPAQLLRILKKDRIDSWEFRKMSGSVAEDFKKRSDRFLRIPEKGRHSPEPVLANPRIIITNSVGGFDNPAPVQEKERLSC